VVAAAVAAAIAGNPSRGAGIPVVVVSNERRLAAYRGVIAPDHPGLGSTASGVPPFDIERIPVVGPAELIAALDTGPR
jgi:hypothetical protein